MAKKDLATAKRVTEKLLKLLGEKEFDLDVSLGEEDEWLIKITVDNPGPLIGYRGKALEALQLVLKMILSEKLSSFKLVLVDVNQYRGKQKERIEALAREAGEEARGSGKEICLPPMSPYERRLVHLVFANDAELETISEGEDEERQVIIRKKTN